MKLTKNTPQTQRRLAVLKHFEAAINNTRQYSDNNISLKLQEDYKIGLADHYKNKDVVVITYINGNIKVVDITADSELAIMLDIIHSLM